MSVSHETSRGQHPERGAVSLVSYPLVAGGSLAYTDRMNKVYDREFFVEQGRKGGLKVSRELGKKHMRRIGARGLRKQGKRTKSK